MVSELKSLVGYPPNFQSKRKGPNGFTERRGTEGFKSDVKPNAHFTKNANDFTKATENQMSSSQYEDLVNKMDKANISDCVANMPGIASLDSQTGQMEYKCQHGINVTLEILGSQKF
ncbi:hypothetical protein H5410_031563 [Solanum commersonii]|uniref:Uncharacterized protein n=1 Tax=Solanum commersonii TaxID=4109 RepID=A0A9J5YIQ2_SOLCO|nr:hypothetical protein H5410_031563 [Solanum commersonii]